jgi:hypothetical protein
MSKKTFNGLAEEFQLGPEHGPNHIFPREAEVHFRILFSVNRVYSRLVADFGDKHEFWQRRALGRIRN